LLTTPESLCLLLSQERWLPRLATVRWLIIDEIHALADNKRGAHLALSVERLAALNPGRRLQRIGLSATVAPLSEVARYLSGTQGACATIDVSTKKVVELRVHGQGTSDGKERGPRLIKSTHAHRHGAIYILMGGGESSSHRNVLRSQLPRMAIRSPSLFASSRLACVSTPDFSRMLPVGKSRRPLLPGAARP